ncbi:MULTISPECIES: dUTP diphosphatase [Carboxydocella]|uniref:Deoxyuridine 5'-triphosphate nucleotidohydrolase n=2 Tax=Carboxydocella TaxID=178898 RepID=A0A1T4P6B4_9FIRM|nr:MULTISPECIES: dUTP diphosphatase [Carboxydocella]AVX20709.1 deoxyuridine 5'-triphosphate nucleotidohydrolase [Carboxydocella thermautotrophica]AVX31128.1 deoxyuridine 5'-triphosphate nucleotidohydrolase [Carboxydocella thermautotrophica]SJZ86857.1 dUTP pyrophosphatase [Carboxydocella sporoproducens DSM 16521]GAW28238.1 deoxyuridine 5'-triphosphate nucleotidohydrolase [Carboxydocella sp. ULO1]GAW30728.1 deoxyuridine 5'-triphosphate nucleotidohydrolase [Carboxydocella sp. JDF658]
MAQIKVPLKKVTDLPLDVVPVYMTEGSAGADLIAAIPAPVILEPGQYRLIDTGIAIALPPGYEAQVRPRSGLAAKHGITCLNTPGTIDADYRGEIKVILINHGQQPFTIQPGERIAQLVIAPVVQGQWVITDELPQTERGTGGFGHTGR